MALEQENATYKAHLPELCAEEGKFALIKGEEIVGCFGTYEDALKMGYEKFGLEPFLVKKISAVEQIQFVSRGISIKCPT